MSSPSTKEALDRHNKYRTEHKVPRVTWSAELQQGAQAWADRLAKQGKLQHASREERANQGENLFFCCGRERSLADAVDAWYSEVGKYNFKTPGFKSGTGHFTQVVWKDTKEIGIAKATGANGAYYIVGRYRPAGNFMSKFEENVFPKK